MNVENLESLRDYLAFTPDELILLAEPPKGCDEWGSSILAYTLDLIQEQVVPTCEPTPPSPAEWLGLDYDEASTFFRSVDGQPVGCLNQYPAHLRKAIILDLIDSMISTGKIDWHAAKARYDIEVSA